MSISVLICCYNGARYLRDTLESVLAQTMQPLEVIVVDDGSTDNSAAIARSFGGPVRVISQENKGLPASRNVAIAQAKGTYLFFIDSDDLIHRASLERLYMAIKGRRDAVAIMGVESFRDDVEQSFSTRTFESDQFFPNIILGNFGPQHNRLVPRELVIRSGGFDPSMFIFEDWLFWCRIALCGARLVPVPFVGAYYRRHEATMSFTAPKIADLHGHLQVMDELSDGMLKQPELVNKYGEVLFWGCWTAIRRAQAFDVQWARIHPLVMRLPLLVKHGPPSLRNSRNAWLIRVLGTRNALRLHELIFGKDVAVENEQREFTTIMRNVG